MKSKTLFWILISALVLGLFACQKTDIKAEKDNQEARWYNLQEFQGIDSMGTSPYDLEFDIAYSGIDGDMVRVNNCIEVSSIGDNKIAEREFVRWEFLKTNCEAATRFYDAPENADSYWPSRLDFSLLKTFPSTSVPYLGGQGLDGRRENLADYESTLTLVESGKHNVKVTYDGMVVNYVVMARGDFNRDGYQDLIVRMDWYIEDAFGDGHDWVVLTKLSPSATPMMLWRK